jgi:hypothetical protein
MIRSQLCQSLDLPHRKTHFGHPDSEKMLPDSADISQFPIISLQIDNLRDYASRFFSCTRASVPVVLGIPSHLSLSLYCLARIAPLTKLFLSDDLYLKAGFKNLILSPFKMVIGQLSTSERGTIEGRKLMLARQNFTFEGKADDSVGVIRSVLKRFIAETSHGRGSSFSD